MDIFEILVPLLVYYSIIKGIQNWIRRRREEDQKKSKAEHLKESMKPSQKRKVNGTVPLSQAEKKSLTSSFIDKDKEISLDESKEGWGQQDEEWNPPVGSLPPKEFDLLGDQPTDLELEWLEMERQKRLELGITPIEKATGIGEGGEDDFIQELKYMPTKKKSRFDRRTIRSGILFHEILSRPPSTRIHFSPKPKDRSAIGDASQINP